MYFSRIPHPANFVFAASERESAAGGLRLAGEALGVRLADLGGNVHQLRLEHSRWQDHGSVAELETSFAEPSQSSLELGDNAALRLQDNRGRTLLQGVAGRTFGVSGQTWIIQFQYEPGMQFYGLGEHCRGFEKSGQRVKFWNTDLFGDFPHCEIYEGHPNPMYVAIPWLVIKQGNTFAGVLVNNPGAVFMDLASNFIWNEADRQDRARRSFYVGAPDGAPELYLVVGPSLAELTRRFQSLVGRTPRPPLWALGHHQCRWGYAGPKDLRRLDAAYRKHGIPCDGLWLDIDYMDRYKVFTFAPGHWRDAAHIRATLAELARRGRRVVPILDPGVKVERGYAACEDGLRAGIFCLNREGQPFIGFVWPGQTYFPDYSLPEGREWWAEHVREFAELGFGGAWIDMNDPSLGAVEVDDMRFNRGAAPHERYHNQYGLGMAQATRAGLLAARPDERPFLLTRSAFISSSRHAAVWLGDNVANWHHLQMAIPLSLGLALSGIPFNGPDVGGFMLDTTPELTVAWYKTGFLFPFFRNHTSRETRPQEPWALGKGALSVIGHYVRLRYKLLPYLYQLFVRQEETGEAIQRPLFYDFADTTRVPLGRIADEFLIGPAILQAPVVEEGVSARDVLLPGKGHWFAAQTGRWKAAGRWRVATTAAETPLFLREGALVPMQPGERRTNENDLSTIELHCFLRRETKGEQTLRYVCDDGLTYGYQRGERTEVTFLVRSSVDGSLLVTVRDGLRGFGPLQVAFVVYDRFSRVVLEDGSGTRALPLRRHRWRFTGSTLNVFTTAMVAV